MSSNGCGSVHNGVPGGLWALGQRRGVYEAFRYLDAERKHRKRRSLSTSSEQEARTLLDELNDALVAGEQATVASCFNLYKAHKEKRGKWTESMERARKVICLQIGDLLPSQITDETCEDMIKNRRTVGFAPDTIRIEMAYLRAALNHAVAKKKLPAAPKIIVPSKGPARERWLTEDEVERLIDGAVELHVKLFIILSVTTAARPSHVLGLQWDRVDMDTRIINFRHLDHVECNKKRPRVPINDCCLEHLQIALALRRTEYVIEFRGEGGFKRIYKSIKEAARRADIKGMSPYVLRHTAGVWMAKARIPMQEIAAFMGHKNLRTTMDHYAHYHPDFLREAASALEIKRKNGPEKPLVQTGPAARTPVEHKDEMHRLS